MKILKRILIASFTLTLLAAIAYLIFGPKIADQSMNKVESTKKLTISEEVKALHSKLTIADLHSDSLLWNRDLTIEHKYGHLDFVKMRQSNFTLAMLTTVTKSPASLNLKENSASARDNITVLAASQLWPVKTWQDLTQRALYQAERLQKMINKQPDNIKLVLNQHDLQNLLKLRETQKVMAVTLGTEGSHVLEGDLSNIDVLYDAGFRMMSLQHFFDNKLGGSLHGSGKTGLTDFGYQAIDKMLEKHIMIDVSHSSEAVVKDVLNYTRSPLIVSHTGINSHCPSNRNISDQIMKQIARNGGLIGIGFWPQAICDSTPMGIAKALMAAVELVGEDHVALGSDFDGTVTTTIHAGELIQITQALVNLNVDESVINKVMGQNQIDFFLKNLPAN